MTCSYTTTTRTWPISMNNDLNHATRRLLQVVLDMLANPLPKPEGDQAKYWQQFRTDVSCVEAAWRAANQAQQMLAEAMPPPDISYYKPPEPTTGGNPP